MLQNTFRSHRLFIFVLFAISICAFMVYPRPAQQNDSSFNSTKYLLTKADSNSNKPAGLQNKIPFYKQNSAQNQIYGNSLLNFENRLKQIDSLINPLANSGNFDSLLFSTNKQAIPDNAISSAAACITSTINPGQTINASLTTDDCSINSVYYDNYTFSGTAGQNVIVTMNSTAFNTYLELFNSAEQRIAFDSDSGAGTNSILLFTLTANGTYTIRARSFSAKVVGSNTGSYTIALNPATNLTISGRVMGGNAGVSGVTIKLGNNGLGQLTTITDANGNYSFTNLPAGGDYVVFSSLTGSEFISFTNLTSSQTANFFTTVTISGILRNVNGNPLTFFAPFAPLADNLAALVPGLFDINVSCENGYSATQTVTSIYNITVPKDSGICTITPATNGTDSSGVTSWNPENRKVSSSQNQNNVDFEAAGPSFNVTGQINPDATGVLLNLSFLKTGTTFIVEKGCSIHPTTRIYTCGLVIYGDYTITPFHPSSTFKPKMTYYQAVASHILGPDYTATPLPALSISNNSVSEGNNGIKPLNFTVNLSAASDEAVTVNYFTNNGAATAGQDFAAVTSGTVTIPAGQTSGTATVQIIGDTLVEPNETFTVILSNPQGATIAAGQAAGTINNDDVRQPAFNFDGDDKADIAVFRPENGAWYIQQSTSGFAGVSFGLLGDLITPADFDGDGKTDIAVFRPLNGAWYYLKSSNNQFVGVGFGQNGDIPLPADFDGDGKADINVFRPANGAWYRLNSSNGQFVGIEFGQDLDVPLIADFDGDGKSDIAVFRPDAEAFYWLNSSNGQFNAIQFGQTGDIPTPADFDGDGKTDIAVFRPSAGAWYYLNSSNGQFVGVGFGQNGDKPVAADYDGDGKADIAVFRDGVWYLLQSTSGFAGVGFGIATDKPVPNAFMP